MSRQKKQTEKIITPAQHYIDEIRGYCDLLEFLLNANEQKKARDTGVKLYKETEKLIRELRKTMIK
jgi:hypothetical protein